MNSTPLPATPLPRPPEPGDIVKETYIGDKSATDLVPVYNFILRKLQYGYDVLDLEDGQEYYHEFKYSQVVQYEIL